jgi:hypothetical protein
MSQNIRLPLLCKGAAGSTFKLFAAFPTLFLRAHLVATGRGGAKLAKTPSTSNFRVVITSLFFWHAQLLRRCSPPFPKKVSCRQQPPQPTRPPTALFSARPQTPSHTPPRCGDCSGKERQPPLGIRTQCPGTPTADRPAQHATLILTVRRQLPPKSHAANRDAPRHEVQLRPIASIFSCPQACSITAQAASASRQLLPLQPASASRLCEPIGAKHSPVLNLAHRTASIRRQTLPE